MHDCPAASIEDRVPQDCVMNLKCLVQVPIAYELCFERRQCPRPVLYTLEGGSC